MTEKPDNIPFDENDAGPEQDPPQCADLFMDCVDCQDRLTERCLCYAEGMVRGD